MKVVAILAMAFSLGASGQGLPYPNSGNLVKVLDIKIVKSTGEVKSTTYMTSDGTKHVRVFNIK